MVIKAMRSEAVSTTWLCWAKNAFIKSVYVYIWLQSNFMYHLTADPVRLFWKKWISNLSFPVWPAIFWQNIIIWALGQVDPLYLTKSCILNFWGMITSRTKLSSMVSIPLIELFPSMAFSLSSINSPSVECHFSRVATYIQSFFFLALSSPWYFKLVETVQIRLSD